MSNLNPTVTSQRGRVLPTYPAAVVAYVVDEQERILMLSHPKSEDGWEPPNGAMDAGETVLDALMRELHEEAGPYIQARPLGNVHTFSFAYDPTLPYMFSISYVLAYEGGEIIPGDDMVGSQVRWFSLDELESHDFKMITTNDVPWIFRRAIDLYRLWKDQPAVNLQPEIDFAKARPKYGKA